MESFDKILDHTIFKYKDFVFNLKSALVIVIAVLITIALLWMIKKIIFRKKQSMDPAKRGSLISVYQIVKYVVWIITILVILESFGLRNNFV